MKLALGNITPLVWNWSNWRREERKQAFDPFIPVAGVEASGKSAHAGYLLEVMRVQIEPLSGSPCKILDRAGNAPTSARP